MTVRNIDVICRHVAGLGTLNGLTVAEEKAFEHHVRASGLTPLEWIRSRSGGRGSRALAASARPLTPTRQQPQPALSFDLDYWPSASDQPLDDDELPDGDDEDEREREEDEDVEDDEDLDDIEAL